MANHWLPEIATELIKVNLYTDGACSGNPGPGGWGAILIHPAKELELSGGDPNTTNNRMELTAVIKGLEALTKPCAVTVQSDSKYIVDAINQGWLKDWIARGWRRGAKKGSGKPVLNVDLWEALIAAMEPHQVKFKWIKGHAGHPMNERADRLAVEGIPQ